MMIVRVLVAVLPQMSMAIDRGRAPRSVRQKSSIGCALFLERTKLPIVVFRSPTRKETRCPTINQVSRVKIQIRSLASRVKTQIKNPANRHRIPAKAASQATRNKKQAARFGGPLYLVYTVVRCCLQNRLERLCATGFHLEAWSLEEPPDVTPLAARHPHADPCRLYRQGFVIGVEIRNCTSFPSF
jgi:hypothetical protein